MEQTMVPILSRWLLDPSGLTPHGFCLLWEPWLIWSQALSDIAIGLAYCSIPIALVSLVRRRRDLAFKPVFWLFAAFILLCGTSHFLELATIWLPLYSLEAVIKIVTALVSVATAAALWPLMPHVLALPAPAQLRAANEALARSEVRYRFGFLHSPASLLTLDADGVITGASDRWLDMLGFPRDAVVGRPVTRFLEPGSSAAHAGDWARLLVSGEMYDAERRLVRRDGAVLDVLVSARVERAPDGAPESVLGAFVDITPRKRAEAALRANEERLRHTQKMEALGQLAGGIAHDFNNILQAVSSAVALVERRAEDSAMVRRFARMIAEATERGSATTRRLLAFARRTDLRAVMVEPTALLAGFRDILAHTLGSGITVRVEAAPDVPPFLADRGELETVLLNLAANARDAMPDGGTLTLSVAAETVLAEQEHPNGLGPGAYVRITVADTGAGMDAATLASATEPFFTTKPVGKGTGLGLAMARGFAQQSGGALRLDSSPGQGTSVTLWLPRTDGLSGPTPVPADPGAPSRAADARPALLLADDDALVRHALAAELEEQGFQVVQADGGAAALACLDAGRTVDLLVTDLSMPGMDGVSLIREAKRRHPDLPAIVITGYAGDAMALAMKGEPAPAFMLLRKPVTGAQIADRAAALLQAC